MPSCELLPRLDTLEGHDELDGSSLEGVRIKNCLLAIEQEAEVEARHAEQLLGSVHHAAMGTRLRCQRIVSRTCSRSL